MEDMIQNILANPVTSFKDLALQIIVVYFLIYKPIQFRYLDARAKKKNGGALPSRRKNDPANPLALNPSQSNPGVADLCARHDKSISEIRADIREIRDRVIRLEAKREDSAP